jgi:hypothetical protein
MKAQYMRTTQRKLRVFRKMNTCRSRAHCTHPVGATRLATRFAVLLQQLFQQAYLLVFGFNQLVIVLMEVCTR